MDALRNLPPASSAPSPPSAPSSSATAPAWPPRPTSCARRSRASSTASRRSTSAAACSTASRRRRRTTRARRDAPTTARRCAGPDIREVAVRLLVDNGREAMHYREWYELLERAGHEIAGKDPLAVFLTQISRSPAVQTRLPRGRSTSSTAARSTASGCGSTPSSSELGTPPGDGNPRRRRDPRPPQPPDHRDQPSRARPRRGRASPRPAPVARRDGLSLTRRGRAPIARLSDHWTDMAPVLDRVRPAEPRDAEAVAAIYNHGIAERQATFETRPRRANEILGWLEEGRPFIVATDRDRHDPRVRARVRVFDAARVRRAWGSTRCTSRPRRAGGGSACKLLDALAAGLRGRRLLQADEPRVHDQRGEPEAPPRRRVHRSGHPEAPRPARRRVEGHGAGRATARRGRALTTRTRWAERTGRHAPRALLVLRRG